MTHAMIIQLKGGEMRYKAINKLKRVYQLLYMRLYKVKGIVECQPDKRIFLSQLSRIVC